MKILKNLSLGVVILMTMWAGAHFFAPEWVVSQQRIINNGIFFGRMSIDTGVTIDGNLVSDADGTDALGSTTVFWTQLFTDRLYLQKGADVASAASSFAVGIDGTVFDITGTTNLDSLAVDALGRIVILHFDGVLTVTDGGNLELTGNHVTEAGDILCLYQHTATNWRELFRIDQS